MIVQKVLILIYHTFYASSHGWKGEQAPWTDFIGVLIPKHFQRTLPVSTPVLETVAIFRRDHKHSDKYLPLSMEPPPLPHQSRKYSLGTGNWAQWVRRLKRTSVQSPEPTLKSYMWQCELAVPGLARSTRSSRSFSKPEPDGWIPDHRETLSQRTRWKGLASKEWHQ